MCAELKADSRGLATCEGLLWAAGDSDDEQENTEPACFFVRSLVRRHLHYVGL